MASFHGLVLLCLLSLVTMAAATQFKVGGSMGWTVSTDPHSMSFNQWAQKHRFHVGDSLLFVYLPDKDSVLLVNNDDYNNCNTSSYIDKFDDGNTVFTFNQPGLFYFISGVEANCIKNETLIVMVMADRSNQSSGSMPPSSPPSPSPPSPTPPPPPGSGEVTPSSGPTGAESTSPPPTPNGASLKVVGFMGSIGAFLGSLVLIL